MITPSVISSGCELQSRWISFAAMTTYIHRGRKVHQICSMTVFRIGVALIQRHDLRSSGIDIYVQRAGKTEESKSGTRRRFCTHFLSYYYTQAIILLYVHNYRGALTFRRRDWAKANGLDRKSCA